MKNNIQEEMMEKCVKEQDEVNFQMLLHHIMHLTRSYMEKMLKETELHSGQVGMLFLIQKYGKLSQKELAAYLHVTPPSMTVAVQKLERMKYVTRKVDENDQRILRLELTCKGEETLTKIKGLSTYVDSILFQNMSVEEKIVLKRLLMQVKDNLIEENQKEGGELYSSFVKEEEYE